MMTSILDLSAPALSEALASIGISKLSTCEAESRDLWDKLLGDNNGTTGREGYGT
jgi:hypothetical protein